MRELSSAEVLFPRSGQFPRKNFPCLFICCIEITGKFTSNLWKLFDPAKPPQERLLRTKKPLLRVRQYSCTSSFSAISHVYFIICPEKKAGTETRPDEICVHHAREPFRNLPIDLIENFVHVHINRLTGATTIGVQVRSK